MFIFSFAKEYGEAYLSRLSLRRQPLYHQKARWLWCKAMMPGEAKVEKAVAGQ